MSLTELESADDYDKTKQVLSEALARARFFDSSIDGRFCEQYKTLASRKRRDFERKAKQKSIQKKQTVIFLIIDIIGLALLICLVSFFLF